MSTNLEKRAEELAKQFEEIISDAYCGDEAMPFQKARADVAALILAELRKTQSCEGCKRDGEQDDWKACTECARNAPDNYSDAIIKEK